MTDASTPIIVGGDRGPQPRLGGGSPSAGAAGAARADEDLLAGLNAPQREAVTYRGQALLIVAGAGSGKTSVLTRRIASLLRNKEAWPSQILAITFTNKAAGEMRERVQHLVGDTAQGMWISTFHSACVRILRREADQFGFTKSFTIYDSGDSRALIKRLVKEHEADAFGLTPAGTQGRISKLKNELADAESYARQANMSDPAERVFVDVFADYQRALQRANAFDFDDLIAQTVYLFRAFPHVADVYRRRFRHILVDEYQDTNHAQYALINELTKPVGSGAEPQAVNGMMIFDAEPSADDAASLTVVGDSDQSIYAFRGADIRNITEFERDYPGAKVVLLEQNYRSTQNILSAANAVIGNNFDRKDKKLWTDVGAGEKIIGFTGYSQHDEAQFVADEVEALRRGGIDYSQMAVFYRTNSQSRALEEIFIRSAVPYKIMGGTKFYERAEIKDALAYLVAVANPADEMAMRRIINRPRRGIGDVTIETISRYAQDQQITFRDALANSSALGVGPKIQASIAHLDAVLAEASDLMLPATGELAPPTAVAEGLQLLLGKSGYTDALRASRDPQDEARVENLDELVAVAREFARNNPEGTVDRLPRRGRARLGCRRPRGCLGIGVAHDDAHRQGPRVRRGVRHRCRRGSHPAPDLGGRARRPAGGATPLLRRHHPRAQAPLPLARDDARAVRRGDGRDAEPVPAGDPRRAAALAPVAWRRELPRGHAVARAQRQARIRRRASERPATATATSSFRSRVASPTARSRSSRTAFRRRCATTATWCWRRGTASVTTTSARDEWMPSPARVAKRIAHVRFDKVGPKKLLIKIAPIEKL